MSRRMSRNERLRGPLEDAWSGDRRSNATSRGVVQMIEFQTARIDDVVRLHERWRRSHKGAYGGMTMSVAKDRDRRDRYVWIVEFPSSHAAMRSDAQQVIQQVAEELAELADGPAVFHNLDVIRPSLP